jgi:hypothetical protein
MSARFKRASITPFDEAGRRTLDDQAVPFDFNPETLTLKTSSGQSRDRARQGRQQAQTVGASSATLSFEAVFDGTRPRDGEDGRAPAQEEALDVRLRTRPLALLIQAAPEQQAGGGQAGGKGGGNKQPAPKRVQFRWGSILFNGLITSYQETFDYFSPGGVPLRSKVQITLTEQNFDYEIDSAERAGARAAAGGAPAGLRDAADAAGADSLFGLGPGGLSLGLSASFSASLSAGVSLQAELGLSADLGLSAAAGVSLSAEAALDVFGAAALGTGGATAGRAGLPATARGGAPVTPSPWAPDGPAPGSSAAGLAGLITAQRAAGTALAAPNAPSGAAPIALRGSPPPVLPRAPAGTVPPALRSVPREADAAGERRPRWEALGTAAPRFAATPAAHPPRAGCGCARCGGG